MNLLSRFSLLGFLLLSLVIHFPAIARADDTPSIKKLSTDKKLGILTAEITTTDKNHRAALPTPAPNVVRTYLARDPLRKPLLLQFNNDATQVHIQLPRRGEIKMPLEIVLETAEKSLQYSDGRIIFSALDAKVRGPKSQPAKAKLETDPGNHRIGFWTNESDYVTWDYKATRPGMYDVELTYSAAGDDGTTFAVSIGETTLKGKLISTGSWYNYTTISVGKLYLPKSGDYTLAVKCLNKTGGAVMNLKAVSLRPTCEGKPIRQAADGVVLCHARDVTIHGVKVQYEPRPIKYTVGYWVNVGDWVSWDFEIDQPGDYKIEILQGCGKGHGGSQVALSIAKQKLTFVVEDTGHFQNFKSREIGQITLGKAGKYTMQVRPIKKASVAVMDLRQVRLIPVKKEKS